MENPHSYFLSLLIFIKEEPITIVHKKNIRYPETRLRMFWLDKNTNKVKTKSLYHQISSTLNFHRFCNLDCSDSCECIDKIFYANAWWIILECTKCNEVLPRPRGMMHALTARHYSTAVLFILLWTCWPAVMTRPSESSSRQMTGDGTGLSFVSPWGPAKIYCQKNTSSSSASDQQT